MVAVAVVVAVVAAVVVGVGVGVVVAVVVAVVAAVAVGVVVGVVVAVVVAVTVAVAVGVVVVIAVVMTCITNTQGDMKMSTESIEQLIEAEVQKRLMAGEPTRLEPGERILKVGVSVFIRTVTHHYTGRITLIEDDAIVLEDAAWIADDGRFANALRDGQLSEVEPYPGPVEIYRGSIVDVSQWSHALPREQK